MAAVRSKTKERIVYDGAQVIPINTIKPHPQNPRIGDVDAVRESLRTNGQFRPVLVQKGTDTIVAGHHLWKAAKEEKWARIGFVYLDVTDEQAKRILIADNRTADLGGYDDAVLAAVLAEIGYEGTGYTEEDYSLILSAHQDDAGGFGAEDIEDARVDLNSRGIGSIDDQSDFGSEEDDAAEDRVEEEPGAFEAASSETAGVFELKEYKTFDGTPPMDIPRLRDDMMVEKLPDNLVTWAGSATREMNQEGVTWLYNYGIDSTSGMKNPSSMILSFYAYDHYFERWWLDPQKYLTKALNTGIQAAITPDFSIPIDDALMIKLYQLYKSRWLGRYFQEVGIRIIPNIAWPYNDIKFLETYVLPGIPVGLPIISFGFVAYDVNQTKEELALLKKCIELVVAKLKPGIAMFYTNKSAIEFIETFRLGKTKKHIQMGRMAALSEKAKGRERKVTL